ncbi:MAG: TonB-dependent receptor plug domain-containing protein [Alphaproteobacteria bacterium]|nr:TonB-dependent receptor plug domain-containing protein [Alphaproteobacteria bacterium]
MCVTQAALSGSWLGYRWGQACPAWDSRLPQQRGSRPEQIVVTKERFNAPQASLSKLPEALLDTPQSVSIVTSNLLKQRGTTNLNDALRNTPGISLGAGGCG